jgi:GT2 family glycosyltransferase
MSSKISVSIVTYHPSISLLSKVLTALEHSILVAQDSGLISESEIFIVDNGSDFDSSSESRNLIYKKFNVKFLTGHGNVGYGVGNNIALLKSTGNYFLVLNPDVIVNQNTILSALKFMSQYQNCGLLAPAAFDHQGNKLSICKQYPSIVDLLARGFFPYQLQKLFSKRLAQYERRDLMSKDETFWNPVLVSGCFMLFRKQLISFLGGFNPKYFMYFEDFDISIRAGKSSDIAYVPDVKIEHYGGNASRKGVKHISMFIRSAITFFSTHGWRWV